MDKKEKTDEEKKHELEVIKRLFGDIRKLWGEVDYDIDAYTLKRKGKMICDLMSKLYQINPALVGNTLDEFEHTLDNEVEIAIAAEKETRGKNAPKIRTTEYKSDVRKAINQLNGEIKFITDNQDY